MYSSYNLIESVGQRNGAVWEVRLASVAAALAGFEKLKLAYHNCWIEFGTDPCSAPLGAAVDDE